MLPPSYTCALCSEKYFTATDDGHKRIDVNVYRYFANWTDQAMEICWNKDKHMCCPQGIDFDALVPSNNVTT